MRQPDAMTRAIVDLSEVVEESRLPANAVDGEPISAGAAAKARAFIRALPHDVDLPEFAWEPDGWVSLDWMPSRHQVFSVSVGDSSNLPYAWLDGAARGHGVGSFEGETISGEILEGIRRVMR